VFDPERDEDDGAHRFYVRLLTIVGLALAVCIALYPSVTGFPAGEDGTTTCVAITNGWHGDMAAPTVQELAAINAAMPPMPTPAQAQDPVFIARFRAQWQAAQARPDTQRANAWVDWKNGPGTCIRESRHRLIVSGISLGVIAVVCAGIVIGRRAIGRRTRTNLRRSHAVGVGT
jgi:hypothetical protein